MPRPTLDEAIQALERGDLRHAAEVAAAVTRKEKANADAWQVLGLAHQRRGWFGDAVRAFEQCARLRPRDPLAHCRLASAHMYGGAFDLAERSFDRALKAAPGHASAIRGAAELRERSGDVAGALAMIEPHLDEQADTGLLVFHAQLLVRSGDFTGGIEAVNRLLERRDLAPPFRRPLYFALGRALERSDQYDAAFEAYSAGNLIGNRPYDRAQSERRINQMIATFTEPDDLPCSPETSRTPVFIVGMPRSGSTLVEQILDAHPDAHGVAETPAFNEVVRALNAAAGTSSSYPGCIAELAPDGLRRAGRAYLSEVDKLKPRRVRAQRLVDKNLLNFLHVGTITRLFPNGRIIHCLRDPLDVGLSCFATDLSTYGFPWSSGLADIGHFQRQHDRLAAHWAAAAPASSYLQVQYESVVDDVEAMTRRILDHCGLEWNDACLRFHETGRAVTTSSYEQVRQPIYRTALKRADRFGPLLDPLREALAAS